MAKEKKKDAKQEKKHEKASPVETKKYRVNLNPVKRFQAKKRAKRAMTFIRRFVEKNTRVPAARIKLESDVNEKVWERSVGNIPNKIDIEVLVEAGTARVFLKESKKISEYLDAKKAKEKKKAEEKKAVEEKKETKEEKKEAAEQEKIEEQKKEEKKLKEKYSETLEMKRK